MGRVIFVEGMRDYREKRTTFGWYLVWFLTAALIILFILEPSWFVIPPTVHNIKVTLNPLN